MTCTKPTARSLPSTGIKARYCPIFKITQQKSNIRHVKIRAKRRRSVASLLSLRINNMEIINQIETYGIIPVVSLQRQADAVPLAKALAAGGLPVVEITFRTPGCG